MFAAELTVFCEVTSRHYAWVYPRWQDQLQYLQEAYNGYVRAQDVGFAKGVRQALSQVSPQGLLHRPLTLLVFEAVGPSRLAALSLNMAAFLALQAATFVVVRRLSQSWPISWAAVAFLAAVNLPWSADSGSTIDFRLDWMAVCAFGVALAAALASDGFRSTRWMVFLGAAVGAAILTRFLTAVYFGLIFLALLSWLSTRPDRRIRCGRLLLAAFVAFALCAPALWNCREAIYSYYWAEPIQGAQGALYMAHVGLMAKVKWLFEELIVYRIGASALALGFGAAGALLAMSAIRQTRAVHPASAGYSLGSAWVVVTVFVLVPAAVLVAYPEKAPKTVSILIPGAVWIIILVWTSLARLVTKHAVGAVSGAVVLFGGFQFASAETRSRETDRMVADFRRINAVSDYLFYRAEESGLERPRVSVTWISDGLNAGAFQVLGFERHHRLLMFLGELPTGLIATTKETVMQGLANSDFVCVVEGAHGKWPFDRQMLELLPAMRMWCESNLRHAGDVTVEDGEVSIYERRELGSQGSPAAVSLDAMVRRDLGGAPQSPLPPPFAPAFVSPPATLASTRADFLFFARAAYSPVTYAAESLPTGIRLDARSGKLSGRFQAAGDFTLALVARNSVGSTPFALTVHVGDEQRFAVLRAPRSCRVAEPVPITYGAFDAAGRLDFIEITDLTERRTLCRIPAPEGAKESWIGTYTVAFGKPGRREILTRTARFDPTDSKPYAFTDTTCVIDVGP